VSPSAATARSTKPRRRRTCWQRPWGGGCKQRQRHSQSHRPGKSRCPGRGGLRRRWGAGARWRSRGCGCALCTVSSRRGLATTPATWFPKIQDLGQGRKDKVAWWNPQVGKENRETAVANCVLGMKIFLLHHQ
jgi:hypothetical protein